MPALKRILTLRFIPTSIDIGLLIVRVGAGLSLFLKHGLEKLTHYPQMAAHFPNPVHIGSHATLAFALLSDGICSVLVALGLFTRWAAAIVFINIFTAWGLVNHFRFFGRNGGSGEVMVLYVVVYLGLIFVGPGRFSIDHTLES